MEFQFESLSRFFEAIKTISFWQRIFGWKAIKSLSYDAYDEFKRLVRTLNSTSGELDDAKREIESLRKEIDRYSNELQEAKHIREKFEEQREESEELRNNLAALEEGKRNADSIINDHKIKIAKLEETINQITVKNDALVRKNTQLEQSEERREEDHKTAVSTLKEIKDKIERDRQEEIENAQRERIKKIESQKDTWTKHQENVKQALKLICQKHTIEYVEKVPFKGSPDNAIKINDEFIIFDAKSPGSEDLGNFWSYIKNQTEAVKKYIKEESVRRDIYLVIPWNTVDVIEQFSYNMADYNVFVVTLDALEPIILSLKKIEDYEFVDQLSPEERENICRVIGRFAHITKRRIQIDQYFAWQFFEILNKSGADLPKDIIDKVIEFEKSEKLNPPQEKRAKQISTEELTKEGKKIEKEAEAKGIAMLAKISQEIKQMPLYLDEGEEKDS